MPAKIDVHAFHRHGILPVFAVMKNIILIFFSVFKRKRLSSLPDYLIVTSC